MLSPSVHCSHGRLTSDDGRGALDVSFAEGACSPCFRGPTLLFLEAVEPCLQAAGQSVRSVTGIQAALWDQRPGRAQFWVGVHTWNAGSRKRSAH